MRSVLIPLSLLLLAAPGLAPARAASSGAAAATAQPDDPAGRLDALFATLKRERNEAAAARIAARIWDEWLHSGSATVDLLTARANAAIEARNLPAALDLLDQVILLKPDYAEGWNRRATVHFMMQNYRKSMADIERTLELEPRHFGALSGMAAILKETGRKQLALEAFERTLAVYPMMRSAQSELATLSDELAGDGV